MFNSCDLRIDVWLTWPYFVWKQILSLCKKTNKQKTPQKKILQVLIFLFCNTIATLSRNQFNKKENLDIWKKETLIIAFHLVWHYANTSFWNKAQRGKPASLCSYKVVDSMKGGIDQLFHCVPYTARATSCSPLKKPKRNPLNQTDFKIWKAGVD